MFVCFSTRNKLARAHALEGEVPLFVGGHRGCPSAAGKHAREIEATPLAKSATTTAAVGVITSTVLSTVSTATPITSLVSITILTALTSLP